MPPQSFQTALKMEIAVSLFPGRTDTQLGTRRPADHCKADPKHRQPCLVTPNDSWKLRRYEVCIFRVQAFKNLTAAGQAGRESHL